MTFPDEANRFLFLSATCAVAFATNDINSYRRLGGWPTQAQNGRDRRFVIRNTDRHPTRDDELDTDVALSLSLLLPLPGIFSCAFLMFYFALSINFCG